MMPMVTEIFSAHVPLLDHSAKQKIKGHKPLEHYLLKSASHYSGCTFCFILINLYLYLKQYN